MDDVSKTIDRARALYQAGEPMEAITLLKRLHASGQARGDSWLFLGKLLREHDTLASAVEAYSQGLLIEPEHLKLWIHLAHAFWRSGKVKLAHDAFHHALTLDPDSADSNYQIGIFYIDRHELGLAEHYLRRAGQLSDSPSYTLAIASIHELRGENQAAYDLLAPHRAELSRSVLLAMTWAKVCRQLDRTEESIGILMKALQLSQQRTDRQNLFFTLADCCERIGRHPEAFQLWEQGNQLRVQGWSAKQWRKQLEQEQVFFQGDRWARLTPSSSPQAQTRVVLIVGMPRSGTSLLEQILSRHPQVQAGGERNHLNACRMTVLRDHQGALHEGYSSLDESALRELVELYLRGVELGEGQVVLTDKMPSNFRDLGLARALFPQLRVIHCVRNPLDNLLSCFKQNFHQWHAYTTNLRWLLEYYIGYRELMAHWHGLEGFPILEHPYHELLDDPEAAVRRVLEFCGLPWEPRCLDFQQSERHVKTASYAQVRQPLNRKSQGRWKSYRRELEPLRAALEERGLLEGFPGVS